MTEDAKILLQDELTRLITLRSSLYYRAHHPRTDPRHALEAEEALELTEKQIKDIIYQLP